MSGERLPPADVAALIKTYREKGSLSASQIQRILDWQATQVEEQTRVALEGDDQSTFGPHDLVAFTMPTTPQGKAFSINGVNYYGACTAPYAVFLDLLRMHQQAALGVQELMTKRGSKEFGLKDYVEFVPQSLLCRLVKRSQKRAA
jgi:hypothetical protein